MGDIRSAPITSHLIIAGCLVCQISFNSYNRHSTSSEVLVDYLRCIALPNLLFKKKKLDFCQEKIEIFILIKS